MEQCRLLLAPIAVRKIFQCAIDEKALKTKETLGAKTEKDIKHEKDLEKAGFSAVALAGKEARLDRSKSFWNSGWAKKLSKIVTGGESATMNTLTGTGRSNAVSEEKNAGHKKDHLSTSQPSGIRDAYSPELFLVLCRVYGIVLSRWGGVGGKDIVRRAQANSVRKEKDTATLKADVSSQNVLNVLCFSTSIVQTCWAMIQSSEKGMKECIENLIHPTKEKLPGRCLSIRPFYGSKRKDSAIALLFLFEHALGHTLIVTDDTEIHDMEKPLPLHQLRR